MMCGTDLSNDPRSIDTYVGLSFVESNHQIMRVVSKTLHTPFTCWVTVNIITGEIGTNQSHVRPVQPITHEISTTNHRWDMYNQSQIRLI